MEKGTQPVVLLISKTETFLMTGLEKQLEEKDCSVEWVRAEIEKISQVKELADAIVLFLDEDVLEDQKLAIYLRDWAVQEDVQLFILADDKEQIDAVSGIISEQVIQGTFARPIDVKNVAAVVAKYLEQYGRLNKKRVLVVDDSGAVLRNVKGWLQDKYLVGIANSGTMAIKYITMNRPDLILLDYEMPVIDGSQVLEMIRSESDFSDIPVIFLTSKNDKESIMKVMKLKPQGYLLKTMKPEEIVKSVDDFFERQKIRKL